MGNPNATNSISAKDAPDRRASRKESHEPQRRIKYGVRIPSGTPIKVMQQTKHLNSMELMDVGYI